MIIETRAFARAGLLGNPSDGYFGKTISIIVKNFGAHISLYETPELCIEARDEDLNIFNGIHHLVESVILTGYYGGERLIKGTIKKFVEYCNQENISLHNRNFTIRFHSSIPRQVGLAGSSAIVTATIRALMKFYDVNILKELIPSLVLSVESDELGINAGLQDRVIQTYEGCVYMDFNKDFIDKHKYGYYELIDPRLLPNLYIAYKTDLGKVSGKVLNDIMAKYLKGDKMVIQTLEEIAHLASEGKKAIIEQDFVKLSRLMDHNFDLRCKIMNINQSNKQMISVARTCGASAKFTGSGGSIIGIYKDDEMLKRLILNLKEINARVIKPLVL